MSKKWTQEFQEFMNASEVSPPNEVTMRVTECIRAELNPSVLQTFWKVLMIHVLVGTLTLLVCPQFGVAPVRGGMGLMKLFMRWGDVGCMLGCGSLFLGSSALVAAMVLRPEELRVVRKSQWVQLPALAGLSLICFLMLGGEIALNRVGFWFLGSLLAGALAIETGRWARLLRARLLFL